MDDDKKPGTLTPADARTMWAIAPNVQRLEGPRDLGAEALLMADPSSAEIAEFLEWWGEHCTEWQAIRDELFVGGKPPPTAHEVTTEQYRRMNDRGESVFAARKRIADMVGVSITPAPGETIP